MERCFWGKVPARIGEQGSILPGSRCFHARSALFIDPMLLTAAARAGVAIAIAIPVEAGNAGRGDMALIR